MAAQFRMIDNANAAQRVRISWEMLTRDDDNNDRPDDNDEGFWPSLDPDACGYIGDAEPSDVDGTEHAQRYADAMEAAETRMAEWESGDWRYIGVIARAHLFIPCGGGSFACYTLDSPGLWGIESDSGDYLREVFAQEKEQLREHLATLAAAMIRPADMVEEDSE